jgi:hypothetical protein
MPPLQLLLLLLLLVRTTATTLLLLLLQCKLRTAKSEAIARTNISGRKSRRAMQLLTKRKSATQS